MPCILSVFQARVSASAYVYPCHFNLVHKYVFQYKKIMVSSQLEIENLKPSVSYTLDIIEYTKVFIAVISYPTPQSDEGISLSESKLDSYIAILHFVIMGKYC